MTCLFSSTIFGAPNPATLPEQEIAGALLPISDHLLKMTEQSCMQSAIWLTIVCIGKLTCINCTQNEIRSGSSIF